MKWFKKSLLLVAYVNICDVDNKGQDEYVKNTIAELSNNQFKNFRVDWLFIPTTEGPTRVERVI